MPNLRRWLLIGLALGALLYLALSLRAGFDEVGSALANFRLGLLLPIFGLSLFNYALRFAKWHYLLRRLGVGIGWAENLRIFIAGLAMAITPGKAGEVLKPVLLRGATGTPLSRTLPALVAERGTDALAILGLAALGVSTYYAEGIGALLGTAAVGLVGWAVLSSERLSLGGIRLLCTLPFASRWEPRLVEAYRSFRVCLAPGPLLVTVLLSIVAWGAEGVGYLLILQGFGVEAADLSIATFLYAFSTIAGAPSPGGLGIADAALQEGALRLIPGIVAAQAVGSALLCRLATLWLGVGLGALALLGLGSKDREARAARDAA